MPGGPDDLAALLDAARAAQRQAYAPYSGFRVGAALLTEAGAVHAGCNVENAAYPVGACAEAGAISAMAAAGGRRIAAIAIVGGEEGAACFPCGACRQRIREFAGPETAVLVEDFGAVRRFSLDDLLPHAFGPDTLPAP